MNENLYWVVVGSFGTYVVLEIARFLFFNVRIRLVREKGRYGLELGVRTRGGTAGSVGDIIGQLGRFQTKVIDAGQSAEEQDAKAAESQSIKDIMGKWHDQMKKDRESGDLSRPAEWYASQAVDEIKALRQQK